MNKNFLTLGVLTVVLALSACVSSPAPKSKPKEPTFADIKDSAPDQSVDVAHIPDAVPRYEPRTIAGNKSPYTVLGKTYTVLPDSVGYSKRGIASWYGQKFHGRKTSNGEIYDMYGMTAAHTTLPIPSFVRVTNLDNGKSIVVRVNDRGPFHDDRIIDLTYAGAKKLGYLGNGTARVEVVALDPNELAQGVPQPESSGLIVTTNTVQTAEPAAPTPKHSGGYDLPEKTYLQAGAFSSIDSANALQSKLEKITSYPVFVQDTMNAAKQLFRVRIGPISDNLELLDLQKMIKAQNLGSANIVND